MDNCLQKIFTIHFPGKKVYIENTCKSLYDKMEDIKNDNDHNLYSIRYSKNIQIRKLELSVIKMEVVIKSQ